MDPVTIAMLISLGVSAAQTVGAEAAKAPARQQNKAEIARLEKMRASGMWLTPTEQALLAGQQTQLSSVLAQGQRNAERIQGAAALAGSGGDVANARRGAAQDTARAVLGLQQQQLAFRADQETARRTELGARQAKQEAMAADTVNAAAENANAMAMTAGQWAAELPAGKTLTARRAAAESFQPTQAAMLAGSGLSQEGARLGQQFAGPYARDLYALETAGYPRRAAQQALSQSGFYTPIPYAPYPTGF